MDISKITMNHLEELGLNPTIKHDAFETLDPNTQKRLMLVAYRCECKLDDIILDLLSSTPETKRNINVYASEDGAYKMVTINTTITNSFIPSEINHPTIKGMKLYSSFGLNPQSLTPEYEWYRPTSKKELNALSPDVKAYVNTGGLILRKIGFSAASKSDQIQEVYRKQRAKK